MNTLKDVLVVIRHSELFYTIIMTHWRGEACFGEIYTLQTCFLHLNAIK